MSIQEKINAIKSNIADAYDAFEEMGATIPSKKNSSNLASTARTISVGIDTSSDNPVTASDMVAGKEAFVNDEKVVGTVPVQEAGTTNGDYHATQDVGWGDDAVDFEIEFNEDRLYRKGSRIWSSIYADAFGDAKPNDVIAGKTFTSFESGLKNEGTMKRMYTLSTYSDDYSPVMYEDEGALNIDTTHSEKFYVEDSLNYMIPMGKFGDAKPEDVTKGKFFTSSSGLKVEGTAEPSSGSGSAQRDTGSFTSNGGSEHIIVDCGFTPDYLTISLPDSYTNYGRPTKNDIVIDMTEMEVDTDRVQGVNMYGVENSSTFDLTLTALYVYRTETGFEITSIYDQDFNGDWWYTNGKTYGYKAIAFNGESVVKPQGNGWYDGVPYDLPLIPNVYVEADGSQVAYNGWSATDYLPCEDVSDILVNADSTVTNTWESTYGAFYDNNKQFICRVTFNNNVGSPLSIKELNNMDSFPENASYVRFSHETERLTILTFTPIK